MASGAFTVDVEGATLAGERRGAEAPPLVLLHGMAGERGDWDRLIQALPADYPILRYDLRGFGLSDSDDREYSHSDDLLALFDTLGIDRATVLGLSMGGGVALNFALSHPDRVSRLILISPAIVGWEWSAEWRGLWRDVSRAARDGDLALAHERWFQHPMFAVVRESEAADDLRHAIDSYHGRQWIRDPQRMELPDVDRLHTLAMPTLLLTGEHDVADMRLIADVIAGAAPQVRRIDFAGAGHMLHIERPQEVATAILG
ncbi:alpha/beta fold hydrolase [Novosphingobium sp. JCM 18896]|uniref:alpha/beta fold hydrolase n=1 Tax=Novosphingobium sp. JCM 18896 TaxID=2989731 RepID=UPI002221A582|nr:alpha/beta fold hydrolase [Novosphingobium sp. JCM 18896]MCW1430980.1 alpha/beta fold hydrolase [Novosphingobium sp. JCM 18896]